MKKTVRRWAVKLGIGVLALVCGVVAVQAVNVNGIPHKKSGDTVSVQEYNSMLGTLRGWSKLIKNGFHYWGFGADASTAARVSLGGGLQLAPTHENNPTCDANFAGFLFYGKKEPAGETHFWYCDGSTWRAIDQETCGTPPPETGEIYTCGKKTGTDGVWHAGKWNASTGSYQAATCKLNDPTTLPNDFDEVNGAYYDKNEVCSKNNLTTMSWNKDRCKADTPQPWRVYMCEPVIDTDGAWTLETNPDGSAVTCNPDENKPANFHAGNIYDYPDRVCANQDLAALGGVDDSCTANNWGIMECDTEAISGQVSTAEINNYETRCDESGNIWQYDMCGNQVGWSAIKTCAAGQTCQQNAGKPLHKHTDAEGNTNIHPAHPDCVGKDCESPRNPAVRFVAQCEDHNLGGGCGDADRIPTSSAPDYSELCKAGYSPTRIALRRGTTTYLDAYSKAALIWEWGCTNDTTGGQELCHAPFYKWILGNWSSCTNPDGSPASIMQTRSYVCSVDGKSSVGSDEPCLDALGEDSKPAAVTRLCKEDPSSSNHCGWKHGKHLSTLGNTKDGLCKQGYRPIWGKDGWHQRPFSDNFEWKCQKISAENFI